MKKMTASVVSAFIKKREHYLTHLIKLKMRLLEFYFGGT